MTVYKETKPPASCQPRNEREGPGSYYSLHWLVLNDFISSHEALPLVMVLTPPEG